MATKTQSENHPDSSSKNPCSTRLVTSFQSLGRIGKSTFAQALLSWADYAGFTSAAIDADEEHRTLSGWYGDEVTTVPFRRRDDLLPILDAVGQAALELIDFPAQSTDAILQGIRDFDALRTLTERGVRLTVALFASEERLGMLSAHKIISQLGCQADYLIVTNPARFTSERFENSKLPGLIPEAGRIHLGAITHYTMEHLDAVSKAQRKSLTFSAAAPLLNPASKHELQAWLNAVFAQCEDHASLLVPDLSAIKSKVLRVDGPGPAQIINPYDL